MVRGSARVWGRDTVEFGRVTAFSDGLFSIAMTLLIVEVAVPHMIHTGSVRELLGRLGDLVPDFVGFFLSFALIGKYWVAHHQMFSVLRGADYGLISRNLFYLAFIAFMPFPTALLGDYFDNPLAVVAYAVTGAIVSGLEVVLLRYAWKAGLLRVKVTPEVMRWGSIMSLAPVVAFLVSIPVAFVSTLGAVLMWLITVPFGVFMHRRAPAGADVLE
ncbi:TMEM175 family protein [Catellatospora sichuanensis]|uniref:TMEM175 family protein n=1 Tax=Catellatospora sichuanensis TaxID=1969805 RepID=UPI0011829FEC|nr:TMEM175 family protein [Catellatospora sichuanensis]